MTEHVLAPDPSRVVMKTFLPGQELLTPGESQAPGILERIMALSSGEVERWLGSVLESFEPRHHDLPAALASRFELVAHRLPRPGRVSLRRRQLIGAYFTQEFAIESAAIMNPSMVEHPDQAGVAAGDLRFVMSARGVGEGHISSIEFRTGVIDTHDAVTFSGPDRATSLPTVSSAVYSKSVFVNQLVNFGEDHGSALFVLDQLGETFGGGELDMAIAVLEAQALTRGPVAATVDYLRHTASCNYCLAFPRNTSIDERVIMPTAPTESHGMEDVRFTRFTEADGSVDYRGTYTAFDGAHVVPQLLRTDDFGSFDVSQMCGPAAQDKGMAIFPRKVGGRYLALSRWDRENNTLAESSDMVRWDEAGFLNTQRQPWEIVRVGNCGPPIETPAGWLMLTHGVGPMRGYSMGAILLDLDDPGIVIGALKTPLISPDESQRDGYVPNVVYSCGGLLHGETLVLPYGCNDSAIRIALIDVPQLLARLMR